MGSFRESDPFQNVYQVSSLLEIKRVLAAETGRRKGHATARQSGASTNH